LLLHDPECDVWKVEEVEVNENRWTANTNNARVCVATDVVDNWEPNSAGRGWSPEAWDLKRRL
jgi:hypothetical protein